MICSSVNLFFTSNLLIVGLDSKLRRYSNPGGRRIYDRASLSGGGRWIRVTLRLNEIDALGPLVDLQKFQLDQLGRAELLYAVDLAKEDNIAQGHAVAVVRDLERMAA